MSAEGAATIRDAVAADASAIADLHARSWSSAYRGLMSDAFLDGPVLTDRRDAWRARFAGPDDPDRIVVVAEDGGEGLAGFCCILAGHDPARGSLVDNLHVRPGGTRGRLGRRLLDAATARLRAGPHAAAPVHITVFDGNARATAAYERWGGRLDEVFAHLEPDGQLGTVRRYDWPNAAALAAGLGRAPE